MKKIRYGIVGCGFFGSVHAKELKKIKNAELVSVYSKSGKSAKKLSSQIDCEYNLKLSDLIKREDIDAIIVTSPNHLHKKPVILAANNKKHILCEKPFATKIDDAKKMIKSVKKNKVFLMVGHMMHFYPGMIKIKEIIESKVLGRPLVAHVERTGWENKMKKISWKKMQDKSGGHLFHHIHEIDFLSWCMGPVESVYCAGGNLAHQGKGFGTEDDILLLTLHFKNGTYATMQYGSGFRLGEHFFKINFEKGYIVLDNKKSSFIVVNEKNELKTIPMFEGNKRNLSMKNLFKKTDGGVTFGKPGQDAELFLAKAVKDELEYFNRVLMGTSSTKSKKELFGGESALHAIKISSACLKSKKTKSRIKVNDQKLL